MRMALILISAALLALSSLARAAVATPNLAVGPQYVTTHVYVAPRDIDRFVESFVATFGGTATKKQLVNVTPTPSTTEWRAVSSPRRRPIRLRFHDAPIPGPSVPSAMAFSSPILMPR